MVGVLAYGGLVGTGELYSSEGCVLWKNGREVVVLSSDDTCVLIRTGFLGLGVVVGLGKLNPWGLPGSLAENVGMGGNGKVAESPAGKLLKDSGLTPVNVMWSASVVTVTCCGETVVTVVVIGVGVVTLG